jgi:hypothetical protein
MDKLIHLLLAEVVPFGTGVVGLYYSVIGMTRIGWPAFRFWTVACVLGLFGHSMLNLGSLIDPTLSASTRHSIWVCWNLGYALSALLGACGTVSLVRRLIANGLAEAADHTGIK